MVRAILIILFSIVSSRELLSQITYDQVFVDYDSAIEYKKLKLVPIRKKGPASPGTAEVISLSAALRKGLVAVSERGTASTENVHWLRIRNNSRKSVYVASGELLAGGRQDRVISKDTILIPSGKDQYVSVMCVEESRWSKKEKKFTYQNYANPRLRKVVDQDRNQVLIWKEIFTQLDSSKIIAPTLSYVSRRVEKKLITPHDEYMRFFRQRLQKQDSSIVGFVCITGEKIIGSDIFSFVNLFYDEMDALLHGYVEEAIAYGNKPALRDEQVIKYMDKILKDENRQEQYLKKNGKIFRFQGKVIHITSYHE